jgi:hypothetical protein
LLWAENNRQSTLLSWHCRYFLRVSQVLSLVLWIGHKGSSQTYLPLGINLECKNTCPR